MSGATSPHGGMTRRNFLKTAGVAAGALGLAGAASMTTADSWLAPAEAHAESEEVIASVCHKFHCGCACSLRCRARDGRLTFVEPNSWSDPYFNTICVKGFSEIERVYGAERLQTPLKRVGERGCGEFVPISWEEAFEIISEKISETQENYGDDAVLVVNTDEAQIGLLPSLLKATILPMGSGIDIGMANGLDPLTGFMAGWATNSTLDRVNSKTMVVFGANNLETKLVFAKDFFAAKEAGCHVIVVDPHFSTTAAKAHEWIPIEPGTDSALLLGMITAVLDNGWYDKDYILANSTFGCLVNKATGELITDANISTAETEGQSSVYLAWDELSESACPAFSAGAKPALSGTFNIKGIECCTVFDMLSKSQKDYPLSWAAEKTGIAEEVIENLAKSYATNGPAMLQLGLGGPDKYFNADVVGHAAGVLATLTGNIGIPGGGVGAAEDWAFQSTALGPWPLPDEYVAVTSPVQFYDMPKKENNIHSIVAFGSPFDMRVANVSVVEEWVKTLDFVMVADIYSTPSVSLADIVLPVSSPFESRTSVSGAIIAGDRIMLREKVIEPLFESRSDFEIECGIAESLGLGKYLPSSIEEYIDARLKNGAGLDGVKLETLIESGGIYLAKDKSQPVVLFSDMHFMTPSGKLEPYYENMLPFGQELPRYEEPQEVFADNGLRKLYPLQLAQIRSRFHIHNEFFDAKWINQYSEPAVELNPVDMEARGLSDGDVVTVFNNRGSFSCRARSVNAIRPGCARTIEGVWPKQLQSGALQSVTNDAMNERCYSLAFGPVIPFNDTLVEVKKA